MEALAFRQFFGLVSVRALVHCFQRSDAGTTCACLNVRLVIYKVALKVLSNRLKIILRDVMLFQKTKVPLLLED